MSNGYLIVNVQRSKLTLVLRVYDHAVQVHILIFQINASMLNDSKRITNLSQSQLLLLWLLTLDKTKVWSMQITTA